MNPKSIQNIIEAATGALTIAKQAKQLIPHGPKKEEIAKGIANAEHQMKIAEAQAAKDFDYELCKCTWPPQIMLWKNEAQVSRCEKCGREVCPPITLVEEFP